MALGTSETYGVKSFCSLKNCLFIAFLICGLDSSVDLLLRRCQDYHHATAITEGMLNTIQRKTACPSVNVIFLGYYILLNQQTHFMLSGYFPKDSVERLHPYKRAKI